MGIRLIRFTLVFDFLHRLINYKKNILEEKYGYTEKRIFADIHSV